MLKENMRKISVLFIFFTTMLPSITWGGVIEQKGVICTKDNSSEKSVAFWFASEKTYEWFARDTGDVNGNGDNFEFISIFTSKDSHYWVTEDNVHLKIRSSADGHIIDGVDLTLDRYTLSLTHRVDYETVATYDCSLFESRLGFLKTLEQISDEYRETNSKKLKKRKI